MLKVHCPQCESWGECRVCGAAKDTPADARRVWVWRWLAYWLAWYWGLVREFLEWIPKQRSGWVWAIESRPGPEARWYRDLSPHWGLFFKTYKCAEWWIAISKRQNPEWEYRVTGVYLKPIVRIFWDDSGPELFYGRMGSCRSIKLFRLPECPLCHGEGSYDDWSCGFCNGRGYVRPHRLLAWYLWYPALTFIWRIRRRIAHLVHPGEEQ